MRIAIDNRKSETEIKYIRMRCEYLQSKYGYTRDEWAIVLGRMDPGHPDYDCVFGLACGGME